MESLDNAFTYEELESWHARLGRDGIETPALLCELKVDGLAINLLYENGRLVRALTRGDGRDRRGRHAQRQDDRLGPAPADGDRRVPGARADRGPRRGVPAGRGVQPAQRVDGRRRQADVRQPPQRRRRLAAPEGPAGHRVPRARDGLPRHRQARGLRAHRPVAGLRRAGRLGAAHLRPRQGAADARGGRGVHRGRRRAPAHDRRPTRSTASSSRSTTSRCSAGSARPAGRRAGRSRSSTRPRRSTPSSSTSGSTSAAPAGRRRTA